jgi:hypothetical protein
MKPPLHITERIWLRVFGTPPKSASLALNRLQTRSSVRRNRLRGNQQIYEKEG